MRALEKYSVEYQKQVNKGDVVKFYQGIMDYMLMQKIILVTNIKMSL